MTSLKINIAAIVIAYAVISISLFLGCSEQSDCIVEQSNTETPTKQVELKTLTASTPHQIIYTNCFFNLEQDGHKWFIYKDYRTMGMSHHPDCHCGK